MTDDTMEVTEDQEELEMTVDPDAASDNVLDAGRYGDQGEAELFSIARKDLMQDGEPRKDRNGVLYTFMDMAVVIVDAAGNKSFVRTGPFGRNTRIEKDTSSCWPRFASQLSLAGRRASEVLPMKVVVDISLESWEQKLNRDDARDLKEIPEDQKVTRRANRILDIFPYEGGA